MKTKYIATRGWRQAEQKMAMGFFSLCCCLLLAATSGRAAASMVTWDANSGAGPNDGNGDWFATNMWWNTVGHTNYTWAGTGDQEYVTFGAGTGVAGTYIVTNNASVSQPFSVTFTNPGSYTITTDGTDVGEMQTIIATGGTSTLGPAFYLATNVSAVINVPWRMVGSSDIYLETNSTLTFGQGTLSTLGQITFKGQAGPGSSIVNFTNGTVGGVNNPSGTTTADGVTLNVSGDAIVNFGTRFDIARSASAAAGYPLANAIVNVGGAGASCQLNVNTSAGNNSGNHLQVSRGGPAVLNVMPGGLVSTLSYISSGAIVSGNLRITPDSSSSGTVNISGGTVNLGIGAGGSTGSTSPTLTDITLFDATTPSANAVAVLNVTGGTVGAKAIVIGNGSAWTANATNQINISGGTVYLDSGSISINTPAQTSGTHYACNLSGGIIGATANWSPSCNVPINLTNLNGNITFQAADIGGNPFNMPFSGPLTGQGGLTKTGGGTLTLSGIDSYAGATIISNGTLTVSTGPAPTNGTVLLDGTTGGSPKTSVEVMGSGQSWSISGLTYAAGTATADFNFTNNLTPSTTTAPIQVNGNVNFAVTPTVTVDGGAIPTGTFPLITYTGTLAGTAPNSATVNLLAGSAAGYVTNITATKTIALVVTSSTFNPAIKWAVGNGAWDINTTANWLSNSLASTFGQGDAVIFDDTASGASPITVTLNTTVDPANIAANNTTKSYIISGSGSIANGAGVTVLGAGSLTLTGTNTYSGGTTVTAPGHLNIDFGGDGGADSAIGTGPLKLNSGAVIDNTSSKAVTLLTSIQESWAEGFTFAGTTNFDTGAGQITLTSGQASLTIASNTFEVDGQIVDNGLNYGVKKLGAGTLVLSNANAFAGGLTLSSGTLDLNESSADGSGLFTLADGTLDNTSGSLITLGSSSIDWGTFIFNGSSSLDMGAGSVTVLANSSMTINSNTVYTEGPLNGANTSLAVNGPGTWVIQGSTLNEGTFGLTINGATVDCNRGSPYDCFAGAVTVDTNGTLMMASPTGWQLTTTASVTLQGGLADFNGDSETFLSVAFSPAGGILRNSGQSTTSQLLLSGGVSLGGTNDDVDVTNTASLTLAGIITNTGSLLKTGGGILTLVSNNTYTGSTVIMGGTLALADPLTIGAGSISNSVLINVTNGATLDASGRSDQTLTLNSGQTLTGGGGINGSLVTAPGSLVIPGNETSANCGGVLTVTNNIVLGGTALFELDRTNLPTSGELVSATGTITGGGTLNVTNAGPGLHVGDTFQLFPAGVSGFTAVNLPATDANGYAYTWNNSISTSGSISVASVATAVNPLPGSIQFTLSGSTLALSWPTNLGWYLQAQTNAVSSGLGTNWVTVPGSSLVTGTNMVVDPSKGCVFFRLINP